ncbi:MAG: ORC1-type DNA replication protein [Candidatus Thermoplasmatota archaeon]|nr:ORC1-type DNA replication protein [Candidatus Thermoplasmatota archaeon]
MIYFTKKIVESDIFGRLLKSNGMFIDREAMRHTYIPSELPHRVKEINNIASVMVPALRGETPSNIFIYGKSGTGKTAVTKFVGNQLINKGKETGKPVNFIYINCEIVDTQYRLLQNITNHFINEWSERVPFTGWPTDEVYTKLIKMIDKNGGVTVIILDEVDKLKGDGALYSLSRINSNLKNAKVSIVGISNDLRFTEILDPRVRSSLGEENMIFPPYDAGEIKDILEQRATIALKPNSVEDDVIPLCSALAAQEHGDARRALDLLRISAELAERENSKKISKKFVKLAQNKIEVDRVLEVVKTLPSQSKTIILSVLLQHRHNTKSGIAGAITPGEVYGIYKELCKKTRMDSLTQRRVADLISELDMLGIITARVISKGRYGRTREINISSSAEEILKILKEDEIFRSLTDYRFSGQTRLI